MVNSDNFDNRTDTFCIILLLASRFFAIFEDFVKLDITLKPLNRFSYAAQYYKEDKLGFLSMYKNNTFNGQ